MSVRSIRTCPSPSTLPISSGMAQANEESGRALSMVYISPRPSVKQDAPVRPCVYFMPWRCVAMRCWPLEENHTTDISSPSSLQSCFFFFLLLFFLSPPPSSSLISWHLTEVYCCICGPATAGLPQHARPSYRRSLCALQLCQCRDVRGCPPPRAPAGRRRRGGRHHPLVSE